MAAVDINDMEDLEDGEIESDSEQPEPSSDPPPATNTEEPPGKKRGFDGKISSDDGKREKKKSKDHRHRSEKDKEKTKKEKPQIFPVPGPVEDDFAGHIEKAILTALKKGHTEDSSRVRGENEENTEEKKKKHKKRKKHDQPDRENSKKRKKMEEEGGDDEMDEDEMMCIRGASPVFRQKEKQDNAFGNYHNGEESDTYQSDGSEEMSRGALRGERDQGRGRPGGGVRDRRHDRPKMRHDFRRNDPHSNENETVCPYYMQGNCYKGNDCPYSHDAQLPRKMELCKFYLMECCAKRDKCLYLHSDFPCKYYHTGLHCDFKDNCKFAHGEPLSDNLIMILLKHIETAPKEILGDFPRLTRENASAMVAETQKKLRQQYKMDVPEPPERNNMYNERPPPLDMVFHNDKNKISNSIRTSRWCDTADVNIPNNDSMAAHNMLNAQNLNGVLSPKQISDLAKLGVENLDQISQLTVKQLNQLGLTMIQINEIQLNTMNNHGMMRDQSSKSYLNNIKSNKDLDMRISPALPELPVRPVTEVAGKDVDMRYLQASVPMSVSDKENKNEDSHSLSDPRKSKNSIDIDQYTKDALKFSNIERNISDISTTIFKEELEKHAKKESETPKEVDIDHRLLKYVRDATVTNVKLKDDYDDRSECDTDIRLSNLPAKQLDMFMRIQKKNHITKDRRPTTDDDEDNLQIDEKWYSSDEDRSEKVINKIKSPPPIVQPVVFAPPSFSQTLEPGTVITKLGDLSKIDISAEVTKLLTTIKSSIPTENSDSQTKKEQLKSRDPRSFIKKSPEHKSETVKKTVPKPEAVSIYDCIEGGSSDSRRRDVDLRPTKDSDYRIPSFGDTDLRLMPSGGDVDLRLGLPFKPLPNYTPATEIDGSISSHLPITYKVHIVDIPRPDYTDIRSTTVASQAGTDPRLRKIFRLSLDGNPLEVEKTSKTTAVRIDPRKRAKESTETTILKPASLDIQSVIQTSNWYKELSSNQKILVNQQLATVTSSLKKFSQDTTPGKVFDLSEIQRNDVLTTIFSNLGVTLDEKGEFSHVKIQENMSSNMAMPPVNFNQNPNEMFAGMVGLMDMNMMGMNPMNGGNMNNMNNLNNMPPMNPFGFPTGDPRGGAGLLGIAPNIPHSFDNSNFNGMPNFNQDNNFSNNYDNGNMFNGPPGKMNDFNSDNNNYDDNNSFYSRNNKKNDYKSYRGGRGGDRWNRGNSRGGRDRRGFADRGGSWKNDRR